MPEIMVIGTFAAQVLRYRSGIINWRLEELKKTRRLGKNGQALWKQQRRRA
jgi:hypothetical protein